MNEKTPLRYQESGNVHLDFHGATSTTIDFIVNRYGVEVLDEIFERVAKDVYADIRAHLMAGDRDELLRHWQHFFDREGGDYSIEATEDEVALVVHRCPAYAHVQKIAPAVSPHFCAQTVRVNDPLGEGTPFAITTEVTGPGTCRQTIRRRG